MPKQIKTQLTRSQLENLKHQKLTKSFIVDDIKIDEETRTVELSFSSTTPYDRWGDVFEVLVHTEDAVDFSRLNDAAALLFNHNWDKQIGVIESAWLDGNGQKCRASVRFSKRAEAEEIYQDVKDKILRNVSVGYQIKEIDYVEKDSTVYVKKWQPYEISIVTIPADNTVGIGRSSNEKNNNQQEGNTMDPELVRKAQEDAQKAERARIAELTKLATQHKCEDILQKNIEDGTSADAFRTMVLDHISSQNAQRLQVMEQNNPKTNTARSANSDIGLTDKEVKSFSFVKAIDYLLDPTNPHKRERAAFEIDASRAAMKSYTGKDASFVVPADVLMRNFSTAEGGSLIATNLMSGSFIDILKNKSVLFGNARKLTGLVGDVDIPRQTDTSNTYWVGEGEDVGEGAFATDNIRLSPKTVGAYLGITRKMLNQGDLSVEMLIRNDLVSNMGLAIDKAALYGDGVKKPLGLRNTTGVTVHNISGSPKFADYVHQETLISQNNADVANMKYLINPKLRGAAKTTSKFNDGDQTIWESGDTINGYNVGVSNQIDPNDMFFGDLGQLIFAMYQGLGLQVDPYKHNRSGGLEVIALQDLDFAVLRPESFAVGVIS